MLSSANTNVGADTHRAVEQPRRAQGLLPDGREELRPRGGVGRLPGPGRGRPAPEQGFKSEGVKRVSSSSTTTRPSGRASPRRSRPGQRRSASRCSASCRGTRRRRATRRSVSRSRPTGAQSVYLGGIVCNNGVKLIKDLRAAARAEARVRRARRLHPVLRDAGRRLGCPGDVHQLRGPAARAARSDGQEVHRGLRGLREVKGQLPPYAVYQAQAAQIMLGRDRAVERNARVRGQRDVQDESHERDHGHVPLRQERRHRPEQVDQLRQAAKGKTGVFVFAVVHKVGK